MTPRRNWHDRVVAAIAWCALHYLGLSNQAISHDILPEDPRALGAIMVRLSADGKSLAFSYQGAIWRMGSDGKDAKRLTKSDGRFDLDPAWSQDGTRVAFVRSPNFRTGQLALVDSRTGDPIPLAKEIGVQGKVFFDRQDRRVLGLFQPPSERPRLAWYDLTTGELTDALPGGSIPGNFGMDLRPPVYALSHDDRTVVLVTTADVPGEQYGNQGPQNDVWRMPLSGGEPQRIVTWPARIHEICWSSDDRSVIVATERGGVHTDLWEIPLRDPDGAARRLTFGQADEASPSVGGVDPTLCYTDNRHGSTTIVLRDMAAHSERIVSPGQLDFGAPTGRASIRVVEGDTPEESTARIAIQHKDGKFHAPPGSLYRLHGQDLHFYAHGSMHFELPAGEYELRAARGPEYTGTRESFTIRASEETSVVVRMHRWTNQRQEGWVSGESHIHANYGYGHWYNSPTTMRLQCEGEDLAVANFMVANSDGDGVFDREFFLGRPDPRSTDRTILYWNEEFRSTIWGHMTLLNLKSLVTPIFTGFKNTSHPHDVPMNADIADHVHDQDGFVNYTHPAHSEQDPYAGPYTAKEIPIDVALGKIDSMDVMSNHSANLALWYRLLNCGFQLPASAGTDCFLNRIPSTLPGAVRVYVGCGEEQSYSSWIDNHRRGRTFVTHGPMLRLAVSGEEPGATIRLAEPGVVRIQAEAVAQHPIRSLELVINGHSQILAAPPADDATRTLRVDKEVRIEESSWVALRVHGDPPWRQSGEPFAHTSCVYVTIGETPIRSAEDARYFVAWIQRLRGDLRKRNQIPPRHVAHVERQLTRAIEHYQEQIMPE